MRTLTPFTTLMEVTDGRVIVEFSSECDKETQVEFEWWESEGIVY